MTLLLRYTPVITYSAMLSCCEKAREFAKGVEVFERMQARGVAPDVITCSARLSCREKAREFAEGVEIFKQMQARGVEPDVIT